MGTDFNMILRLMFLSLEFLTAISILTGNFMFLSMRMLMPNQYNLVMIEPRRQMASSDSIESLSLLVFQYQSFVVPFLTNAYMLYLAMSATLPGSK